VSAGHGSAASERFGSPSVRHKPSIDIAAINNELAQLEEHLQQVREAAEQSDAALATLEEQRVEREGQLALARRAEEDLTRRVEEKRAELEQAKAEASVEAYDRSVNARDAVAEQVASAVRAAVAALGEYDAAQKRVGKAWETVLRSRSAAGDSRTGKIPESGREPKVMTEAFETLAGIVRERLDGELERDLIEAAARSPMGNDIPKLPAHLQALARERRRSITQEARGR
jgi:DNA repair exonuclease SbcCD ATPase subunit